MPLRLVPLSLENNIFSTHSIRARDERFNLTNFAEFTVVCNEDYYRIVAESDVFHSEKEAWLVALGQFSELRNIKTTWSPQESPNYNRLREARNGYVYPYSQGEFTALQVFQREKCAVTEIFTEREPCEQCRPLLEEILMPNAPVYYGVVYPPFPTYREPVAGSLENLLSFIEDGMEIENDIEFIQRFRSNNKGGLRAFITRRRQGNNELRSFIQGSLSPRIKHRRR